jgi:PTH1 family peptidyl-tRNA hydrolase
MTQEARQSVLIVGLGNPGKSYEKTRHNIGFVVGRVLAKSLGIPFENKKEFSGEFAQGEIDGKRVMILLPMTYMNLSGQALRRCLDFFKIEIKNVLVVCDDVAIPFGKLRLKEKGSSGGHNGLKSIESHLGTQDYSRLRIGIGREECIDLADFVLGQFNTQEIESLPEIVSDAAQVALIWFQEGYLKALQKLSKPKGVHPVKEEKKKIIQED